MARARRARVTKAISVGGITISSNVQRHDRSRQHKFMATSEGSIKAAMTPNTTYILTFHMVLSLKKDDAKCEDCKHGGIKGSTNDHASVFGRMMDLVGKKRNRGSSRVWPHARPRSAASRPLLGRTWTANWVQRIGSSNCSYHDSCPIHVPFFPLFFGSTWQS